MQSFNSYKLVNSNFIMNTYMRDGIDYDLATKPSNMGISKTTFEKTSNKHLREKYLIVNYEIEIVKHAIIRIPIKESVNEV